MTTSQALSLARELELDLVEISPKADPPVCRITEYKKFLYDQKKKQNTYMAAFTTFRHRCLKILNTFYLFLSVYRYTWYQK